MAACWGRAMVWAGCLLFGACAQASERLDQASRRGTSEVAIQPVFGQIVLFALPDGFVMLDGGLTRKGHFVRQSVLAKETAQRWTQRITLSGDEALAFSDRTYPQKMVDDEGARIRKGCPASFSALPLPGLFVGTNDTAVAVFACGTTAAGQSEAVLHLVIKGGMDVYTLEWATRGPPSRSAMALDEASWRDRLSRLAPIRLCPIVPNEQPPFPSCLQRR